MNISRKRQSMRIKLNKILKYISIPSGWRTCQNMLVYCKFLLNINCFFFLNSCYFFSLGLYRMLILRPYTLSGYQVKLRENRMWRSGVTVNEYLYFIELDLNIWWWPDKIRSPIRYNPTFYFSMNTRFLKTL